MSNAFQFFQEKNANRIADDKHLNAEFIFKSYQSTEIEDKSGRRVMASVVNKQENDKAYIYTHSDAALPIGSTWSIKNGALHLLVSEEVVIIKDVDFHKYLAFICNTEFEDLGWGWFIGPEKSYVDVQIKENAFLHTQQKPVLVLPSDLIKLEVTDKVVVKGRPYLVHEYDNLSNSALTYYSLTPTTVDQFIFKEHKTNTFIVKNKDAAIVIEQPKETITTTDEDSGDKIKVIFVDPLQIITLSTTDGFIDISTGAVKVTSVSSNKVKFQIPFGLKDAFEVKVKTGSGSYKTYIYKARN